MIALGSSLLFNFLLLVLLGFAAMQSRSWTRPPPAANPAPKEAVVLLSPEMVERLVPSSPSAETPPPSAVPLPGEAAAVPLVPPRGPRFARTSEDQRADAPDRPSLIGERNTRATSDAAPDPNAPPLPAQRGIAPRHASDLETTQSDYQDGRLRDGPTPPAGPREPLPPAPAVPPIAASEPPADRSSEPAGETVPAAEPEPVAAVPTPRNSSRPPLQQGPHPVDSFVPRAREDAKEPDEPAPQEVPEREPPQEMARTDSAADAPSLPTPERPEETLPDGKEKPADHLPKPSKTVVDDPAFRGNQKKTAIRGSISRRGRSALDVADTPLGRYQAALSRAVELEWQRNCVRHRDFITPGFLTVRFFVEPSGKVRNVQFVGELSSGDVQKGFTLNSIRNANIPAMPAALREDFASEPLEMIFNFYF